MKNKPKILYLITQAEWGGAQRYVYDLAISMRENFETFVATGAQEENYLPEMFTGTNVRVFEIKNLIRKINIKRDVKAVFEIRCLLKEIKPQILHLNSTKAGVLGALATIGLGIKVVYTVHGWVFLEPLPTWKRWFYIFCEKIACRFRHSTILLSQKELDAAKFYKLDCGKTEIIAHGIDTPQFLQRDEARQALRTYLQKESPNESLWMATIANLYETKAIKNLIESLCDIKENFFALIIGSGPLKTMLEKSINSTNLSNRVFLAGRLPQAWKFLKAFDLFVLPSAKEGFPYVILEAMSAGLPIVATDVGAIPEMIENEKSGLMVPPKNPEALKIAIESLLKNETLRSSLGKNAEIEFKQKFSKEKMVSETQALYNGLLL